MTLFNPDQQRINARYAVLAGFLGWTFDAFDFFVLVFTVSAISNILAARFPPLR